MKRSTAESPPRSENPRAIGDEALEIETQALLGPSSGEMQMAAHAPEEFLAALEQAQLLRGEQARPDKILHILDLVDIFADPEQRMQIPQPALAILHIGLDEVTRRTGLAHPPVTLLQLGIDEFGGRALHDSGPRSGSSIRDRAPRHQTDDVFREGPSGW